MTFVPKKRGYSFDFDFMYSEIPEELIGQQVTKSELEKMFPDEKIILMDERPFPVFGFESERTIKYLAYQCEECDKLILGPPKKEHYNTFKHGRALSGSAGHHYYCQSCGDWLGEGLEAIS